MMTVSMVVVFGIAAAILFIVLAVRQRAMSADLDQIAARIREIDVESFRRLMNPAEQEFLRNHLPLLEFRRIHYERMLAATEYVWAAAMNARIMMRLAEAAEQNATAAVVATAERLKQNASIMCLHALKTIPRLLLNALGPRVNQECLFIATSYAAISRQALMLKLQWCSDHAIPVMQAVPVGGEGFSSQQMVS